MMLGFLQMIPSETPQDAIFDRATLSPLRLLMPEDLAWSRFNLARRAGYQSAPGSIPLSQADVIFKKRRGSNLGTSKIKVDITLPRKRD